MTTKDDENTVTPISLCKVTNPQRPNSNSISYPSPPTSTSQTTGVSGEKVCPNTALGSPPLSPPPTPLRKSTAPRAHEKQTAEEKIDAATLRASLGIDDKRCGAPAKTGKPCRCLSPAVNRAAVTSQLDSITGLTQSSVELEDELDKLAKLVHCKYHDNGLPKKNRIETWIRVFPVGEEDAAMLIEKKIRTLLDLESSQCIAVVDCTDLRCREKIGGQRVSNCASTIDEIVKQEVYSNTSYLNGLLKVLETNMYCPKHIKERPLQKVASWRSTIEGFLPEKTVMLLEGGVHNEAGDASSIPKTGYIAESVSASEGDSPTSRNISWSIPNFDRDLSTYWPVTYNTSTFDILEESTRPDDYESSYKMIKEEMNKPLEDEDIQKGYVYMYEVEGNPGFVKIGYTTQSVEKRLQDWEFKCNRATKTLYPVPLGTATAIPHAKRVEALCHTELDHRRIRIYCNCCLTQHLEWFRISSTEAITVIQKWSNWMTTSPYKSWLRNRAKWTIKEEERVKANDMNRFLMDISESIQ
ncbi:uncharacterized protein FIESC28_05298 [Fusarium coffeatum]|uniref:Bacteriophage T5 Orf172 DNA-binding domain-containing protein n=1 Tax=Fusarium coffeatum TaxID=231269 RepID=A0A366RTC8_9HYPO|nr:uncharacterized protein FIESC28_05298 [Fusarium coffeatum]RBR20334.1 hypothetical protein FIESC28_05298 [Fusarium coffeatum]